MAFENPYQPTVAAEHSAEMPDSPQEEGVLSKLLVTSISAAYVGLILIGVALTIAGLLSQLV